MSTFSSGARWGVVVGCLVLLGAGCRGTGPSPAEIRATSSTAETGPEGMVCRHEYYPLVPGYRALYRTSIAGVDKGTYTLTVPWVRNNEAYLTAQFVSPEGGTMNSSQQFRCFGGALEAQGYMDTGALHPGGSSYNNAEVHTEMASGSFFPEMVKPGTEWESKVRIKITPNERVDAFGVTAKQNPFTMEVVTHKRAIGLETIPLPIGKREAMKIEVTTSFDGVQTLSKTEWWVKNVGMVQSLTYGSILESDPPVLTELNDYVAPGL